MGGPAVIDGVSYDEFDNFFKCEFVVNGIKYISSEQFFQCQKTFDNNTGKFSKEFNSVFSGGAGIGCWTAGSKVTLRKNWDKIRVDIMYEANKEKIEQNPQLLETLIKTEGQVYFFESTYFWNYWNARIIERIRATNRRTEKDLQYLQILEKKFEDFKNGDDYNYFEKNYQIK